MRKRVDALIDAEIVSFTSASNGTSADLLSQTSKDILNTYAEIAAAFPVDSAQPEPQQSMKSAVEYTPQELKAISISHLETQLTNQTLLLKFGKNAHMIHNHILSSHESALSTSALELKRTIETVNKQRMAEQRKVGRRLVSLEEQWIAGVNAKVGVELENEDMQAEIENLKRRRLDTSK